MRHLKSRDQFLSQRKVDESITNDVSWGDSLVGRLLNTGWRIAWGNYKGLGITELTKQLKNELLYLVAQSKFADNPEIKEESQGGIEKKFYEETVAKPDGTVEEYLEIAQRYFDMINQPPYNQYSSLRNFRIKLNNYIQKLNSSK